MIFGNAVTSLLQDVNYALRAIRTNRRFLVGAVAMLSIGIGVNVAVFTVAKAAVLDGFPLVEGKERLVCMTTAKDLVYYADFLDWRTQAQAFDGLAMVRGVFHTVDDGVGPADTYFTTQITSNMFELLGVKPFLGRDFSKSDEQPGAPPVVILRYEMWVRRFGANTAIVGGNIRVDGSPAEVIGVMPAGFSFPADQDLWMPLVPPATVVSGGFSGPYVVGRLAHGVDIKKARAEMETIGHRLESAYPSTNQGMVPVLKNFDEWFIGPNATALYKAMWFAVGFVLLIIAANVSNLLLERGLSRSHEISIRLALGAGRKRISQQLLAESLMISLIAGAIGWTIAGEGVRLYALAQKGNGILGLLSYTLDNRVMAYLVAVSIALGLLVGLTTAAHLMKLNIGASLRYQSRATSGKQSMRLSDVLVTAEMVLAMVLLASAGVTTHSFLNVYRADLGVNTANVMTASLYIPPAKYATPEAQIAFYDELAGRLQSIPGVESVGFGTAAPTDFTPRLPYELETARVEERIRQDVTYFAVSTGYFRTLGAQLIRGREFDDSDRTDHTPVAIVNQRFAAQNWPGQAPLGKRLRLSAPGKPATPWLIVVGVISNIVQNDRTRQTSEPIVYVPYSQRPQANMFAFARSGAPSSSLVAPMRQQIYMIDPNLSVPALMPLGERLNRAYAFERQTTVLFLTFAFVAVLVASVGLYATISHAVGRRVQEIGIRVVLGASGADIFNLVFKQAALPVGLGLSLGLAASSAGNRLLRSQLVGVSPVDSLALIAASSALILAASLGCWIPARRAMRVDPVIALRNE